MLRKHLLPGGPIRITKNVLEFQKRLGPVPIELRPGLIELGKGPIEEKLHPQGSGVDTDFRLMFIVSALEFVFLRELRRIVPRAFEQENGLFFVIACHLGVSTSPVGRGGDSGFSAWIKL